MDIISEFENGDAIVRIDGFDMPLHSAAPDLLAALGALVADCEAHGLTDNDAHLREARAAISKAKGN